jgi:5'-nucleotidase
MRRGMFLLFLVLATATLAAPEPARVHVLITNDDGIDAPGLQALVAALKDDFRITVAAPAVEQSGVGHGITYRTPVLVEERPSTDGVQRFAIHAQPDTCTRIGVTNLLAKDPPALVLSGINRGDNVGQSVWISGTLGGAREGALLGLPAVALSAAHPRGKEPDFAVAARICRLVIDQLLAAGLPLSGQVVKVEIPFPAGEARGIRVTRMGLEPPKDQSYEEKPGPHGERLFYSHWAPPDHDAAGTDTDGLVKGFVTISPLTVDETDYQGVPALAAIGWRLPGMPLPPPAPTPQESEIQP